MPRALKETGQFRKDKKRVRGSGRHDWNKMRLVVKELMNDRPLPARHRDHDLSGDYVGARECHVEPPEAPPHGPKLRSSTRKPEA